jgi:SagB-type dehydrogenase family enzyme
LYGRFAFLDGVNRKIEAGTSHAFRPGMATPVPASSPDQPRSLRRVVWEYHARTKHRRSAYAAGPETLDWDAQPAPFRRFTGARVVTLPREEDASLSVRLARPFASLSEPPAALAPSPAALGALLHLSLGITAWKKFGPDEWAVRANPSSGNLHPVEAYLVVRHFPGLADGVYHYRPDDHALECRAEFGADDGSAKSSRLLAVGLSTVMWREAWKYGERAFRYCQLDVGHAVGALHYAAAVLGWSVSEQPHVGSASLAQALGLDRSDDFPATRHVDTEREEPELLLSLSCDGLEPAHVDLEELRRAVESSRWSGVASTIDAHPMYRWPVVNDIAAATRFADCAAHPRSPALRRVPRVHSARADTPPAAAVILGRRSAQRFDPRYWLGQRDFFELLELVMMPGAFGTTGALARTHGIHMVLFVHRVDGLDSGVYLLTRSVEGASLAAHLAAHFELTRVTGAPPSIDLRRIAAVEKRVLARVTREVHCRQDITAQACFAAGMVAEFEAVIEEQPAAYRSLHREAGLLGHVLYLEAEAHGLRGTGIGCYHDDAFHELLELSDARFQSLYHFAIGKPLDDARIETTPTCFPGPSNHRDASKGS